MIILGEMGDVCVSDEYADDQAVGNDQMGGYAELHVVALVRSES